MTHIAICEDCPKHSQIIKKLLGKYAGERPYLSISETLFTFGEELLKAAESNEQFDIFLIVLSGANGIEIARNLRKYNICAPIIFIADTADYALDAFDIKAKEYLMKPIDPERFYTALDECITLPQQYKEPIFIVKDQSRIARLPFSSIIYIELCNRTMKITLDNGNVFISKTLRVPFNMAIEPLLKDKRFIYAHKSYVLNMYWVKELTTGAFLMLNDDIVPIPRYKQTEVKQIFMDFCNTEIP